MKTREPQGSFIILIWTLMTKVQQVCTAGVPIHPRADSVADLLLRPLVSRVALRRRAEEGRFSNLVVRYSSYHPCASSCGFPFSFSRCWTDERFGTDAASN